VDGGAAAAPAPDPAPAPAPALDPAPAPDPALASLADMMRCSRSVFEPQVRPLCGSFEDAGVPGALSRLHRELEECAGPLGAPSWVWSLDFAHAVARCAQSAADAERWVAAFGDLAQRFGGPAPPRLPGAGAQGPEARAATARLAYGAMLEAFAAQCAAELLPPDEAAGARVDQPRLARLYADAYGAAVWTSAHAEYLALVDDLLARASPPEDASARALMVPPPELYSVLNLSHLLHLGPLYERTVSPKCCTKAAQPLLSILARVTNAGSRGWESTLLAALKESDGAVRVCAHAVGVALSGLNPAVHPAARAPWRKRFALLRALRTQQTHADFKELATKAPTAVKEAIRLHLAGVLAADCATLDALRHTRQPAGQLVVPPHALPHPSFAAAMHAMAAAGVEMLDARVPAAVAIQRTLTSEPRSRKKAEARAAKLALQGPEPLVYSSSWLGGRSGPGGAATRPAAQVVSSLFSAAHRATYIPFWLHGHHHGHRASRLDAAQHAALHHLSPAHRLCALLSAADYAEAQRLAFTTPASALLTVAQACQLLGIAPAPTETPGLPCAAASRAAQEAEVDVMTLAARDAALLFAFTRLAVLRASILSYDLGAATRRRQALAVCQRMLLPLAPGEDPIEAVRARLPAHASTLFCCSECKRIVNSVQDGGGKDTAFNELGLSASMLLIDGEVREGHMRCAKRSSAALRTAVALEAAAEALQLEQLAPVGDPLLPRDLRPATVVATMCCAKGGKRTLSAAAAASAAARDSSSEVAKFRRDLKSCYEQGAKATSCGDVPLVRIPILGRVARVFGNFYAICAMCGALARVAPGSRFRDDICCMRCDFAMLVGKAAAAEMAEALPRPPPPSCRYCGKAEPVNGSGMKWRRVQSPADTGGRNAGVPAPLRVCWCAPLPHASTPTPQLRMHTTSTRRTIERVPLHSTRCNAPYTASALFWLTSLRQSNEGTARRTTARGSWPRTRS